MVNVEIVYTDDYNGGEDNELMKYAKKGDSGFDLRAAKDVNVEPDETTMIPTGIKVAVPEGYELQVRTRSGSPVKRGFFVGNSPGTIDSGYRGEISVIVHNFGKDVLKIKGGERIAQGVICPVYQAHFIRVNELDKTERGENGFHSSGYN